MLLVDRSTKNLAQADQKLLAAGEGEVSAGTFHTPIGTNPERAAATPPAPGTTPYPTRRAWSRSQWSRSTNSSSIRVLDHRAGTPAAGGPRRWPPGTPTPCRTAPADRAPGTQRAAVDGRAATVRVGARGPCAGSPWTRRCDGRTFGRRVRGRPHRIRQPGGDPA